MKTLNRLFLLGFFALLCLTGPDVYAEGHLRIGGTGSALGTMKVLAAHFEKANKGVTVEVLPSLGSGGGIKAIVKGAIDIAVSSRPLKENERSLPIHAYPYGMTPLLYVVQPKVNVSDLSFDQLKGIYEGNAMYWPNGERIRVVLRPKTETDTMKIRTLSPAINKAVDVAHERKGMLIGLTDQDSADLLENTPGGMGTIALAQLRSEHRSLNVLSLNGVAPTAENIRDGKYPLQKTFSIIIRKDPSPLVKRFVDLVFSGTGKKVLMDLGYIPFTMVQTKE